MLFGWLAVELSVAHCFGRMSICFVSQNLANQSAQTRDRLDLAGLPYDSAFTVALGCTHDFKERGLTEITTREETSSRVPQTTSPL